jgi:hypothetical protein
MRQSSLGVDVLEHGFHARAGLAEGADGLGFAAGGADLFHGFGFGGAVALVVPFAEQR